MDSIDGIVDQLQTKIRQILQSLRPASVDGKTFDPAVNELIDSWRSRLPNIRWSLDYSPPTSELDTEIASVLYRSVQECLTNVAKHADASEVTIRIRFLPTTAELTVSDNGIGISDDTPFGLGLIGMQERAQALGGLFEIVPRVPSGVVIKVLLPTT